MFTDFINNPISTFIYFGALIISITVHEFSHAYAADKLGDPTARLMGRLTPNPMAHLDPIGTLLILFAHFGWGKPVPFDPYNLKNPRRDSAIISVAGPASNLLLALAASILLQLLPQMSGLAGIIGNIILEPLIILNVGLAIFNLVPIHPLDGFKIVEGILPEDMSRQWSQLQSLGIMMMLILVFPFFGSSPVLRIISPIISTIISFLIPATAVFYN